MIVYRRGGVRVLRGNEPESRAQSERDKFSSVVHFFSPGTRGGAVWKAAEVCAVAFPDV